MVVIGLSAWVSLLVGWVLQKAHSVRDISLQDVCEGVPFKLAPMGRKTREQN